MVDLLRQRPEPVAQLGGEAVDSLLVVEVGQAAVEAEPHLQVLDIGFRNEDGGADVDLRRPLAVGLEALLAGAELRHRLLDHLLIES